MTEDEWLTCERPFFLLEHLQDKGSDRKHLLTAIHACRTALRAFPLPVLKTALILCDRQAEDRAVGNEFSRLVHVFVNRLEELKPDPINPAREEKRRAAGKVIELVDTLAGGVNVNIRSMVSSCSWDLELGQVPIVHDIFGNPFRPVIFSPEWRTDTAVSLARGMYESRDFSAMPILADALQDAGCDADDILNHCRGEGPHVRGCWVVDLVLGKE